MAEPESSGLRPRSGLADPFKGKPMPDNSGLLRAMQARLNTANAMLAEAEAERERDHSKMARQARNIATLAARIRHLESS